MRLSHFEVQNYRSISDAEFSTENLTILIGKNNSGKSTVLDAIRDYSRIVSSNTNLGDWFQAHVRNWNKDCEISFSSTFILNEEERSPIKKSIGDLDRVSSLFYSGDVFSHLKHSFTISKSGLVKEKLQTKTKQGWLLLYEFDSDTPQTRKVRFAGLKRRIQISETEDGIELPDVMRESRTSTNIVADQIPNVYSRILKLFLGSVRSIDAVRNPDDRGKVDERRSIQPNAKDLAQVLNTYSQNEKGKFREIVDKYIEIMDGVTDVRTPISSGRNVTTTTVIDEKGVDDGFSLADISSGSKEILSLITSIVDARDSENILLIEEPELHLHPEAERALLRLIQQVSDEGPQVVLTTHSDVFVDEISAHNIIRVKRKNSTILKKVDREEVTDELADLGYNKSQFLQSKGVVFVEGKSDERILRQFGKKFGFDFKSNGVILVELDGEGNIASDGRSLVKLLYQMDIPYRFIVDSHGNEPKEVRNELLTKLNSRAGDWHVKPDHFIVWSAYGIESYLVQMPSAIESTIDGDIEEIETTISENQDVADKSAVLNQLFQSEMGEKYDKNHHGMMIAKQSSKEDLPNEVINAIEDIKSMTVSNDGT